MIHTLIKDRIAPFIGKEKLAVLVIDNLRYDQWKTIEGILGRYFQKEEEDIVFLCGEDCDFNKNREYHACLLKEHGGSNVNIFIREQ